MSMRRPRIKAAAILPPKRPARESLVAGTAPKQPKIEVKSEPEPEPKVEPKQLEEEKVQTNVLVSTDKPESPSDNKSVDQNATTTKPAEQEVTSITPQEQIDLNDNDIFKSPPMVANFKRTESISTSDVEGDRVEDFYQKGGQGPPSPVKIRQRIRPTPFFGMRRNSLQGYGSDMEDEPRRQRHTSTSSSTGPPTPIRIRPPNIQRIRTESSCSNISDFGRDQNARTPRKLNSEENPRSYLPRKDILARFKSKVIEKASMKMSDLIYYNPSTNRMVAADPPPDKDTAAKPKVEIDVKPVPEKPIEPEVKETAMPVPQLKLGPDGEMILDEQSLVIETTAEKEARVTLANTKVIYMDEFSGNSGFYRRNKRTKDWPPEETIKFYRCLHTVGTDFSLMLSLFPNRSRRDLKLKFKKEEKTNLALVNKALLFPKTFNVSELKEELEREQKELDEKRKQLEEIYKKKAEITTKKKVKSLRYYTSRSGNVLQGGDLVYDNEVVSPPGKESKQERKKSGKSKKTLNTENGDKDVDSNEKENKKNNKKIKEEEKLKIKKEKEELKKQKKEEKEKEKREKKENKEKKKIKKDKDTTVTKQEQVPEFCVEYNSVLSAHEVSQHKIEAPDEVETEALHIANGDPSNYNAMIEMNYKVSQNPENIPLSNGETVLLEFTTEPLNSKKIQNYKIINCGSLIPNENASVIHESNTLLNPKLEDNNLVEVYQTVDMDSSMMSDSMSQQYQEVELEDSKSYAQSSEPQDMSANHGPEVPILYETPNAVDLILNNALISPNTKELARTFPKSEVIIDDTCNFNEYYIESPAYETESINENDTLSEPMAESVCDNSVKDEMQHKVGKVERNIDNNLEGITDENTNEIADICKADNIEQAEQVLSDEIIGKENVDQQATENDEPLAIESEKQYIEAEYDQCHMRDSQQTVKNSSEQLKEENPIISKSEAQYPEDERNEESSKDIDAEMERFMHNDLGTILTNLINGSLVVVSSEDENIPDKIVNEIYVMDKETGRLSEQPLDLPEDIVNCIVEELNAS